MKTCAVEGCINQFEPNRGQKYCREDNCGSIHTITDQLVYRVVIKLYKIDRTLLRNGKLSIFIETNKDSRKVELTTSVDRRAIGYGKLFDKYETPTETTQWSGSLMIDKLNGEFVSKEGTITTIVGFRWFSGKKPSFRVGQSIPREYLTKEMDSTIGYGSSRTHDVDTIQEFIEIAKKQTENENRR